MIYKTIKEYNNIDVTLAKKNQLNLLFNLFLRHTGTYNLFVNSFLWKELFYLSLIKFYNIFVKNLCASIFTINIYVIFMRYVVICDKKKMPGKRHLSKR